MKENIFDIAERYNSLLEVAMDSSLSEEDLKEIMTSLDDVEDDLKEKLQNYQAVIFAMNDRTEILKKHEARLEHDRKVLENKVKRIKEYCMAGMQAVGINKVATDYGTVSVRKNGGKQQIKYEKEKLPREFFTVETVESVNTDLLRERLQAGEEIEGAKLLERGYHLSV